MLDTGLGTAPWGGGIRSGINRDRSNLTQPRSAPSRVPAGLRRKVRNSDSRRYAQRSIRRDGRVRDKPLLRIVNRHR